MKSFNKPFALGLLVSVLFLFVAGLFVVDIGINSKFFIEKHFSQAFEYRTTGDCDSFSAYVYRDVEKWRVACEEEKAHNMSQLELLQFKVSRIGLVATELFCKWNLLEME